MAEAKFNLYDVNCEIWNKHSKQIFNKIWVREHKHIKERLSLVNHTIKQGIECACKKYKIKITKEYKPYKMNFENFKNIIHNFMLTWEPRLSRDKVLNEDELFKKARGWYDQNKHKILGEHVWKPVFIYIETYATAFMDCIHINLPNLAYTMYYIFLIQIIIDILDLEIKIPGTKKQPLINYSIIIRSNELIKYFKIITGNHVDISLWIKQSNSISSTQLKRSCDVQIVYNKFYAQLSNILDELIKNYQFYNVRYGYKLHNMNTNNNHSNNNNNDAFNDQTLDSQLQQDGLLSLNAENNYSECKQQYDSKSPKNTP